jgi:hypothetical protein
LILARATHLDSLAARLEEPRVRRVRERLIAGSMQGTPSYHDDFEYVRDLGLVAENGPVRVSNPIYREVIVRVLASGVERKVGLAARSFVLPDGRLDLGRILAEFLAFWREHGDVLASEVAYHEVAPQLVLMAYLERVVNSGGRVERDYAVGWGRIDLGSWTTRPKTTSTRWKRRAPWRSTATATASRMTARRSTSRSPRAPRPSRSVCRTPSPGSRPASTSTE